MFHAQREARVRIQEEVLALPEHQFLKANLVRQGELFQLRACLESIPPCRR
jgi:hypothetical protein